MTWLYRRNNLGKPTRWRCYLVNNDFIELQYGVVNGKLTTERYKVKQLKPENEVKSRYNEKYKTGYRPIEEIVDSNVTPPVKEDMTALYHWLDTYLPYDRYSSSNTLLPMLAKVFDHNTFKRVPLYYGQWKINGLRCIISAVPSDDMFSPYKFRFQSREGTFWNGLETLASYMFQYLPTNIINLMINDGYALDGEIYYPGATINQINHYVKDTTCAQHKFLQYWCYDIIAPDASQQIRFNTLYSSLDNFVLKSNMTYDEHLNNENLFNVLPYYEVGNETQATDYRNKFINAGFEGLILRNPEADYQFGKRRAGIMVKYKDAMEGDFQIIDIYEEKTRHLPIILCRNDINDETFETRLSVPHSEQELVLDNKDVYIGAYVHAQYGERSGVKRCPLHVKEVIIK